MGTTAPQFRGWGTPGWDAAGTGPVDLAFVGRTSTSTVQNPVESLSRQVRRAHERLPQGFYIARYYWDVESGGTDLDARSRYDVWQQFADAGIPRDGGMADLRAAVAADNPPFSAVICENIERSGRDTFDALKLEKELRARGMVVFATDEPIDVQAAEGSTILVRRMKQGVAEYFRYQLKAQLWEGLRQYVIGGWNTGRAPRAGVKVGGRGFCCMSRFDVFSGLQAEQVEGLQAGAVPGEVAAGCGVVRQAGTVQDTDDSAGNGGEQPGGAAGPQPGGVFGVCGIASQVKAVLDAPVAAVAGEQELRAGLGGGERGEGEHGLAGDLVAGRAAGHVRVVAGGAAGGGGAAADVVPVPFDEHHLGGAGEPAGDAVGDLAGDADGADFVPAVAGLGGGVQHRLVVPGVGVGEGVQARLVVFQVEDPADPQLVHRLHVPGLRMQCVGRHDDQLFSFSCSFSCFVAVAVVVVVVVVVWAAVVAGAGVAEDGVQEGDEAGDLVGFRFDVGLAQDGAGGDIVGGEQVGLGAAGRLPPAAARRTSARRRPRRRSRGPCA